MLFSPLLLATLLACSGMEAPVETQAPAASPSPDAPTPTTPASPSTTAPEGTVHTQHPELSTVKDPPEVHTLTGATELNNAGHRYYEAGNYVAAIKVWTQGAVLHPEHALLHYNLACAQALQRAEHGPCGEVEVYMSDIFGKLEVAATDPKRRARMRVDSDLASIRSTLAFQRIASDTPLSDADTKRWLSASPLYSVGNGAFGSLQSYTLNSDGSVVRSLTVGGRYAVCGGPDIDCPEAAPTRGTWTFSFPSVTLNLDGESTTYILTPRGSLFPKDPLKALHVWPSECDA